MIRQTSITIIKTAYMRILKQTDTYLYIHHTNLPTNLPTNYIITYMTSTLINADLLVSIRTEVTSTPTHYLLLTIMSNVQIAPSHLHISSTSQGSLQVRQYTALSHLTSM